MLELSARDWTRAGRHRIGLNWAGRAGQGRTELALIRLCCVGLLLCCAVLDRTGQGGAG